jgi:hypothetical protein
MDRHLRPNRNSLAIPTSGSESQGTRAGHGGGVERGVARTPDHLDAIDAPDVIDSDAQNGLTLHVLIPHMERILDRDLSEEGCRLLDLALCTAASGYDHGDQA